MRQQAAQGTDLSGSPALPYAGMAGVLVARCWTPQEVRAEADSILATINALTLDVVAGPASRAASFDALSTRLDALQREVARCSRADNDASALVCVMSARVAVNDALSVVTGLLDRFDTDEP